MMQWLNHNGMGMEVPAKRIVSLVPSLTELLFDLGLDEEVVGISKFCIHPDHWYRCKKRVGGTKNVDVQKLLALQPDLVIASKEENVAEQVVAIAEQCPVLLTDVCDIPSALNVIIEIGRLVDKEQVAADMVRQVRIAFHQQPVSKVPAPSVAYCIWRDPWMFAGGDTFIHAMLQQAGFANILAGSKRYPVLTPAALSELQPDHVFLSSEPFPFTGKHMEEMQAILPTSMIWLVDGEIFSWYGSRMLKAPSYFSSLYRQVTQLPAPHAK